MNSRTSFSLTVPVLLLLPAATQCAVADTNRPNFIIVFCDDQGYQDLGCFGSPNIRTPNVDRLAAEGMRFTDFYSAYCVCSASRASLLTGCYQPRISMPGVLGPRSGAGLHPDEVTIADLLKTKGYATMCIGKWHVGDKPQALPTAQGFDKYFGLPYSNDMARQKGWGNNAPDLDKIWREKRFDIYNNELYRDEEVIESPVNQITLTDRYTAEAVKFIEASKSTPFFLYFANTMPHVPLFVSDKRYDPDPHVAYKLTIEHIDWSVGQMLKPLAGEGGTDAHYGNADPLRGCKMTTWEGGVRVPCIVRWPGRVPVGRVCDELLTSLDLLPTFAHLAGAELPNDRTLDGHNIWDVLSGAPDAHNPRQTFFYYCYNHLQAVRRDQWKLVLPRPAKPKWCSWSARMIDQVNGPELYDLVADVGETRSVAAERPEVVAELQSLIEEARRELGDFNRVGSGARFFDAGPRRPDAQRWISSDSQGRPVPIDHSDDASKQNKCSPPRIKTRSCSRTGEAITSSLMSVSESTFRP